MTGWVDGAGRSGEYEVVMILRMKSEISAYIHAYVSYSLSNVLSCSLHVFLIV